MSVSQLFNILTNFLGQIYQVGDTPLFGNVTINDFWFGFAIMAVLISTLIVFGRSVPISSISSYASKVSSRSEKNYNNKS